MTILTAILSICREIKLNIIPEGVETKAQFDFLIQQGCNEFQGFYLGHPCTAKELDKKFLQKRA